MEQIIDTGLYYLSRLGSLGLLIAIFLDAMGLPFPGGLMIVMSGFLIHRGDMGLFEVGLAIFAGYLSGAFAAYFIGAHVGQPFFDRYGRYLRVTPRRFENGRQWLKKSAPAFIILGRFIPTLGNITPYMAGLSKIKPTLFLFYSVIYVLLWGGIYITVGYVFSDSWRRVSELIGANSWIAVVLLLLVYFGYRQFKKSRHKVKN